MTVFLTVMIGFGCAGAGYLIRVIEVAFSERERAALAALGGCDWCDSLGSDGLTLADCECTVPCDANKPWCRPRREAQRQGRQG